MISRCNRDGPKDRQTDKQADKRHALTTDQVTSSLSACSKLSSRQQAGTSASDKVLDGFGPVVRVANTLLDARRSKSK